MEKHWEDKEPYSPKRESDVKMRIRRFLRSAVYGTYKYNRDRLSRVYDLHLQNTREYFAGRKDSLLELDITGGEGFDKLCPFLNKDVITDKFPDVKRDSYLQEVLL